MSARLYGFGVRGIAVNHPEEPPEDAFAPIPLYTEREPVEEAIARQNEKHGVGGLSVMEYEVQR